MQYRLVLFSLLFLLCVKPFYINWGAKSYNPKNFDSSSYTLTVNSVINKLLSNYADKETEIIKNFNLDALVEHIKTDELETNLPFSNDLINNLDYECYYLNNISAGLKQQLNDELLNMYIDDSLSSSQIDFIKGKFSLESNKFDLGLLTVKDDVKICEFIKVIKLDNKIWETINTFEEIFKLIISKNENSYISAIFGKVFATNYLTEDNIGRIKALYKHIDDFTNEKDFYITLGEMLGDYFLSNLDFINLKERNMAILLKQYNCSRTLYSVQNTILSVGVQIVAYVHHLYGGAGMFKTLNYMGFGHGVLPGLVLMSVPSTISSVCISDCLHLEKVDDSKYLLRQYMGISVGYLIAGVVLFYSGKKGLSAAGISSGLSKIGGNMLDGIIFLTLLPAVLGILTRILIYCF
jgi:hypothetical protein